MKLNDRDLNWVVKRLPKAVRELLKERDNIFLAGGFIRAVIAGEEVNDIDLFAPNKDVAYLVVKQISESNGANDKIHTTDNAYTVIHKGTPVQVIHRWTFETAHECVQSFDFTIASAAIYHRIGGWRSTCHENFYQDLAAKRLIYLCPQRNEDAGGSILRVLKFYQRGYRIPLDSMGAVLARLVKGVDFAKIDKSPTEYEAQLAKVLTGLLLEVDPNIAICIAEGE